MRSISQLLAILIICLVGLALPAAPVQAADGASISLSPDSAVPGTNVTIYGYNFTAGEALRVYYYHYYRFPDYDRVRVLDVQANNSGDFEDTFEVPESYKGTHEVRVYAGSSLEASQDFTALPGLTVEPDKGPVGTNVTVKGHGFAEEAGIKLRYYLGANQTLVTSNITADGYGRWQRVFQIPAYPGGVPHKIEAEGKESGKVGDASFEVTPWITLDMSSGSPGEAVLVTGSGFFAAERDISILFGGAKEETGIRANSTGQWQARLVVPEKPKGTYKITAEGERTDKADVNQLSFVVAPGLVVSSEKGHVGMNVTVIGRGFAAGKDVDLRYDGNKVATNRTSDKGSFNVTFELPESQSGDRPITAEVDGRTEASAMLSMEADPPPTPDLISPAHRIRLGIVGNVMPTFSWSAVNDPSGVRYELQIATTANVTTAGFANPVVSKTGMTATNYTLTRAEALPHGTYYWIVRAVDRAGNAGRWTGVYSFRVGFMPLWAFIASIVGILVVIGLLVYFFVIRRRAYYY